MFVQMIESEDTRAQKKITLLKKLIFPTKFVLKIFS